MPAPPNPVGPPPTTKPPTPPQLARGAVQLKAGSTGTLGKGSREYRTPPVVVPPQVPSHYAPNYPVGHPRRQTSERGPGYSAVPMPPSQQIAPVSNVSKTIKVIIFFRIKCKIHTISRVYHVEETTSKV